MRDSGGPPYDFACCSTGARPALCGESRVHVTVRVRTMPDRALPIFPSIIFGMKRSVTGSSAEIKDVTVTLLTVQAALSVNELPIQTSHPTRQ
jgi:hypothetical protein